MQRWLSEGELDIAIMQVLDADYLESDLTLETARLCWIKSTDFKIKDPLNIPFVSFHKDCFYRGWAEQAIKAANMGIFDIYEIPGC